MSYDYSLNYAFRNLKILKNANLKFSKIIPGPHNAIAPFHIHFISYLCYSVETILLIYLLYQPNLLVIKLCYFDVNM